MEVHMEGATGAWRQLTLGSDDGTYLEPLEIINKVWLEVLFQHHDSLQVHLVRKYGSNHAGFNPDFYPNGLFGLDCFVSNHALGLNGICGLDLFPNRPNQMFHSWIFKDEVIES